VAVTTHLRSFDHSSFPPERVGAERQGSISVCVPTRECADTIAPIAHTLAGLREQGVLDQVVVVDADSADGTADRAAAAGAEVHQQAELLPDQGPVLGKGDAMWRALTVLHGDVVCYLDGDSERFGPHFACGLAGAVTCEPGVHFAKAFYRRPFRVDGIVLPEGGGRVTELAARPLLRRFYPELGGMRQPLAGEIAAPRALFERLPFATGYAVEIAMLIDAYGEVGLDGLAQVDLDVRQNRHQPLRDLGPMADAVLGGVAVRLAREGRLSDDAPPGPVERPPLVTLAGRVEAAS
jgi:glucosyl-3-phosphoglycerate synthase